MPAPLVLIVDDDASARYGIRRVLEAGEYRIREADSGEDCLTILAENDVALVLLDVSMPGMGGLQCLEELSKKPHPPVVMITAYGNERLAVDCLRKGAYDYLPKPYEIEELKAVVARAVEKVLLETENRSLKAALVTQRAPESLGTTPAMQEVERLLDRIAPSDVTALVIGESGTGKELVARALHVRSERSKGPFIAVNCAALPEALVESELFGHEKGAFTGATETRKGKFEQADSGTLFLDEIGEMTPSTQSKLLRVLAERSFERVGGTRTLSVDVRVVAATNKNLFKQVEEGAFREDLYYRLKVAEIRLPPLRDRVGDIPLLATRFLVAASARSGRPVSGFATEAMELLKAAPWRGNVRELKNAVEYAVVMSDGGEITQSMLPGGLLDRAPHGIGGTNGPGGGFDTSLVALPYGEARKRAIEDFERHYVEARLREAKGNVSEAARAMGIARQSLQAKIKDLDIDTAIFRVRSD